LPGLQAAAIHGDGLTGLTYDDGTGSSSLVLFDPDGTITAKLDLLDSGSDLTVDGDDAWFIGDAGQGEGIVHVRLTGPTGATAPPTPAPSVDVPPQDGLPEAVADTRARIFTAAELGDYELLRDVMTGFFVPDARFQSDPIGGWESLGTTPLDTMMALLQMPFEVEDTNEGTLYRWPRFGPDSTIDDLTSEERDLLATVFTDQEIDEMFRSPDDGGYIGPQLGILVDGTWWFFRLDPAL
jgi:hypothetical protein